MAFTLEQSTRLNHLRAKAIAEQMTLAEAKEALALMAGDRDANSKAAIEGKTKKAEAARPLDTTSILAGLKANAGKIATSVMQAPQNGPGPTPPAMPLPGIKL